ncbi:MAG TPA: lytic transglycosylase domain-containing protein [Methylomirabilota bacterium]
MSLTLGGGYLVAGPGAAPTQLAAEEAEIEESLEANASTPTLAEIMAQIDEVATRHRVPPRLVAAVIAVESEFNPRAVSRAGARGLMQLMPATASSLDVQDSFDTRENIEGGVRHLRVLMDRYRNDLPVVLAAYNAGDTAVLNYRGVPPYRETRQYVIRVLRRYDRDAARAAAVRIYGARSKKPPKPSRPPLQTRLMSYSAPQPAPTPVSYRGPALATLAASASASPSVSASVSHPDPPVKERWVPVVGKSKSKLGKESP